MSIQEGQLLIKNARIGYPKIFAASAIKGDPNAKPRFGCQIYIPKSDEAAKAAIDKEIARLAKIHTKGVKPKASLLPIKDGDGEDGDENTRGYWILAANRAETQGRPQVVDRSKKPIDSSEASTVYGGCWCNFLVGFFFQQKWGRICCGLEIVQKVKEGESFGAPRANAEEVMPDLPEEEEEGEEAGFGV